MQIFLRGIPRPPYEGVVHVNFSVPKKSPTPYNKKYSYETLCRPFRLVPKRANEQGKDIHPWVRVHQSRKIPRLDSLPREISITEHNNKVISSLLSDLLNCCSGGLHCVITGPAVLRLGNHCLWRREKRWQPLASFPGPITHTANR